MSLVVEDYFNLVSDLMFSCPREYLNSSLFPTVFKAIMASFSLREQYALVSVIRHCRIVLDHMNDLQLSRSSPTSSRANSPRISTNEATIVKSQFVENDTFVSLMVQGIIYTFPPEIYTDAAGVIKALAMFCPQESVLWFSKAVSGLEMSPAEMQKIVTDFSTVVSGGNWSRASSIVLDFTTLYRRKNVIPRSRSKK